MRAPTPTLIQQKAIECLRGLPTDTRRLALADATKPWLRRLLIASLEPAEPLALGPGEAAAGSKRAVLP